ncbi:putative exported protein [Plasmodium gaboni]|uniref:Putative exported protein n=1 Tax=Plasmodium gaboni TaxID=647221 RepID=A0A151L398_9APIC|nr:putative exported protein [Plasmodium gaboni]KYN93384.1 putative exported protein [Plasmodium gaboni]SCQ12866.1 Plasmodium exported protein, unknown function [Plasmodium gaboni]SOV24072.1 Plasmodium exported protein, unknown function [Plasmodium sp. DRC-Itaito]
MQIKKKFNIFMNIYMFSLLMWIMKLSTNYNFYDVYKKKYKVQYISSTRTYRVLNEIKYLRDPKKSHVQIILLNEEDNKNDEKEKIKEVIMHYRNKLDNDVKRKMYKKVNNHYFRKGKLNKT